MSIVPFTTIDGTEIDVTLTIIELKYPGLSESSLKNIRTELEDGEMVFELDILRMERKDSRREFQIIGWATEDTR